MKKENKPGMNNAHNLINSGISIGENGEIKFNFSQNAQVKFDWSSDSLSDIVHLVGDTSGEFDDDGVRYIYGYEFTDSATITQKAVFRDHIKGRSDPGALRSEDVYKFAERAVLRLDKRYPLKDFKATVHIEPSQSPALVDVMSERLSGHMNNACINFKLVKETYDHVEFDPEKAAGALREGGRSAYKTEHDIWFNLKRLEALKGSGELFKMDRFVPREIKKGFSGFLKFKTEEERKAYEALQGVNVLMFDDFMTSGTTAKEMIRCLRAIHDKNTLTVFVLMKT